MSVSVTPYRGVVASGTNAVTVVTASAATGWVELIASTSVAILVTSLISNAANYSGTVDLAIGASGSELIVAQAFAFSSGQDNASNIALEFPLRISSGTRVAMRSSAGQYTFGISYVSEGQVS